MTIRRLINPLVIILCLHTILIVKVYSLKQFEDLIRLTSTLTSHLALVHRSVKRLKQMAVI